MWIEFILKQLSQQISEIVLFLIKYLNIGFVFFLLLNFSFLQCQDNNTIFYNLKYVKDSLNNNEYSEERMLLIYNDTISVFISENFRLFDSIRKTFDKNESLINMGKITNIPKSNFKFKIFKLKNTNSFIVTHNSIKSNFSYLENNKIEWDLMEDTLSIKNFKCKKATTSYGGRDYVAWYTKSIPIIEGPYKFYGLPGLIVKLYDKRKNYIFEIDGLGYNDINFEFQSLRNDRITKEEYFKFLKNERETLGELGLIERSPEIKRKILEAKRKNNNPIELKLD